MGLWHYCEQSVRWVFGTRTGDRNAEKILTALRHVTDGMTKTEISTEVFNRHASSTLIDEALRLLHGLAMVSYRTKPAAAHQSSTGFSRVKTVKKANKGTGQTSYFA